jgi:hypothetical protein
MNRLWITGTFKAGYQTKRAAPAALFNAVREGITKLRHHPIPESLGSKKKGGLSLVRGYKINLENRILFGVRDVDGTKVVALLRVCDHPTVYQQSELSPAEMAFFTQVGSAVLAQTVESEGWLSGREQPQGGRRPRQIDFQSMYR